MKPEILLITFEGLLSPVFQNQFIPTARTLSRQYNVSLVTVEKNRLQNKEMITRQREILRKYGIRTFPLPSIWLPLKLSLPANVTMVWFVTCMLLLARKFHAIHIRRYDAIAVALLAKRIFRCSVIFDPRGMFVDEKIHSGRWRKDALRTWVYRHFEKKMLEKSDAVVAFSEPYKRHLENLYGQTLAKKIVSVPNSVDLSRFRDSGRRNDHHFGKRLTLVYIGGASYWHMVDEMIYFFRCLKQEVPCFFLYVAYEGRKVVARKFKNSDVDPNDYSVITVPPIEIPKWLSSGDVGIALIRPSLAKEMCAPIKFVEYLAAGLPVIINPGIGETEMIVRRYRVGIIYERTKIQRNIRALLNMLREKGIRQRCRDVVGRHYALEQAVKGLSEAYRMALQGREDLTPS